MHVINIKSIITLIFLFLPIQCWIATAYKGKRIQEKPSPKVNMGIGPNKAEIKEQTQKIKANLNHLIFTQDQSEETKDLNKKIILINVSHISAGLLSIKKIIGPKNQKKIIPFSKLPFELRYFSPCFMEWFKLILFIRIIETNPFYS